MARMGTICGRLSYGSGTALAGCGISTKACAETAKTAKEMSWMLADRVAGSGLSNWTVIVGITYTVIICVVNWYYRQKERENRLNGNVTKTKEQTERSGRWSDSYEGFRVRDSQSVSGWEGG